jgi:predicted nucleic acid-binding protein
MKAGAQVPNNDCWIAACCVVHNLPLLTHDQDFKPLAAQGLTLR